MLSPSCPAQRKSRPLDGPVIAFASAARKINLRRRCLQQGSHFLPGFCNGFSRLPAPGIQTGGISKPFAEIRLHRLKNPFIYGGCRCIIQIHRIHLAHPTCSWLESLSIKLRSVMLSNTLLMLAQTFSQIPRVTQSPAFRRADPLLQLPSTNNPLQRSALPPS